MNTQIRILFALALALMSAQSVAGRQGIHFLYGGGGSVVVPAVTLAGASLDPMVAGEVVFGVEEDGWAAEYSALKTLDAGTGDSGRDYNTTISQISLSYRTVERNSRYYKYRFGFMDQNFNYTSTTATPLTGNAAVSTTTSGKVYGIAMGFRFAQTERLEVEYSYYARKDENAPLIANTHMLTLRYLFGGVPFEYSGF